MNDNQKKGIAFIVGGVLSIFILPFILRLVGLYMISYYLTGYYIIYIIALVLVGLGIKTMMSGNSESETSEPSGQLSQTPDTTNSTQTNKVVNVTLTGGIIGLLAASPQNSLNNRIKKENANGWRVIQVIPAASGNIFLVIFRLLILVLTLFFYTPVDGFYIIMEKK